jgi:hypothetical protein
MRTLLLVLLSKPNTQRHDMSEELEIEFAVHEAICAQRYEAIQKTLAEGDKRMTKIEYLLYAVMLCVLFGPGVAGEFVKKLLGL